MPARSSSIATVTIPVFGQLHHHFHRCDFIKSVNGITLFHRFQQNRHLHKTPSRRAPNLRLVLRGPLRVATPMTPGSAAAQLFVAICSGQETQETQETEPPWRHGGTKFGQIWPDGVSEIFKTGHKLRIG